MDKSTLSNYGWIVIAVLVLAVMIALATPFGSYIKTGVENTTQGLFDTSEKALNVVGMSAGDGSFDSDGSGTLTPDPALNPAGVTLTEGTYTYGDYKYTATFQNGANEFGAQTLEEAREIFKSQIETDTGMSWNDFLAILAEQGATEEMLLQSEGLTEETFVPAIPTKWSVVVLDKTKAEYGAILESINGAPITDMTYAFQNCTNLTTAPEIPNSVTKMLSAFYGCTSLTNEGMPTIPSGVKNIDSAFMKCTALTDLSSFIIPNSVESMYGTFWGCTSLEIAPSIPSGVTSMQSIFNGCTNLSDISNIVIPSGVTYLKYAFSNCTSLTTAPKIPNGVEVMSYAFENCTSLIEKPIIPNSVTTSEQYIFIGCTQFGY